MEYQRQFDRIQADFALHAGQLLAQYCSHANALPAAEQYEGTMAVCVLHALLTNCMELLDYMTSEGIQEGVLDQVINPDPNVSGLRTSLILQNEFPDSDPMTLKSTLKHMRNAVSHPSIVNPRAAFTPTGYTTTNHPSGRIEAFIFTDSPWVKDGERDYLGPLPVTTAKAARSRIRHFLKDYEECDVEDYLDLLPLPNDEFDIARHGTQHPYWPIFQIKVELPVLIESTAWLANFLARQEA